jgi:ABC-type transporter Mla subunit MlaD
MKYKFNPYERAVGMFLSIAVIGSLAVGVGLGIKKNWLEEKIFLHTYTDSAANLRIGSSVLMSGLKVGKLEDIQLENHQRIKVTFSVLNDYVHEVDNSTRVQFIRPFVIGEKSISLIKDQNLNEKKLSLLKNGSLVQGVNTIDLLDVLTGEELQVMLGRVDSILKNVDKTMVAGLDIANQIGEKKKLKKMMDDIQVSVSEVRKTLPMLTAKAPKTTENIEKIIADLSIITSAVKDLKPEGAKTIELLHESVITLKAMQKSMLLRSNVEEVKEEMAQQEKTKRLPASQP